ncbi:MULTISPECIES: polysaccharide pyruvyl transferase family protein [unclassified Photobacterium]|uniref:polysaccharide pyruvyl transferase family protein n=1 Tax=unclassified Photobacterium TaxID=2628852 RepID=UPI001EDEA8CB|nr:MULTISPECIES: polysaccharide pyruvyl transferase family protein [unclassified Photobacterium]MCG3864914.1 polysaccharide pyruvyl transferase family protein [Photobacterium sp. Ph6]MCG3876322.1 polysaccharide pyruvyl transferase family protein [Photobacterium sp. Ph5]
MKIVKYSPIYGNNIGDLMISKCIENLFLRHGIIIESRDFLMRDVNSFEERNIKDNLRMSASFFLQNRLPWLFYQIKKTKFELSSSSKKYISSLDGVDGVIFGGGNILMSNKGCDYAYRVVRMLKSTPDNISKNLVFCGAGPFEFEEKKLIKSLIKLSDSIFVRDEVSYEYFDNNEKVKKIADPVFTLSDISVARNKSSKYIGVNIIANYFSQSEILEFAKQLCEISEKLNMPIKIINTAFPQDSIAAVKLKNSVKLINKNILIKIEDAKSSPQELADIYSDVGVFIGCRMHSIIFALTYGIPSIGFMWDDKVSSMFDEFYKDKKIVNKIVLSKNKFKLDNAVLFAMDIDQMSYLNEIKSSIYLGVEKIVCNLNRSLK